MTRLADAGDNGTESAAGAEDSGAPAAGAEEPTSPDSWQAAFKRIEEAWLAALSQLGSDLAGVR